VTLALDCDRHLSRRYPRHHCHSGPYDIDIDIPSTRCRLTRPGGGGSRRQRRQRRRWWWRRLLNKALSECCESRCSWTRRSHAATETGAGRDKPYKETESSH
jgi:hypothetical protein